MRTCLLAVALLFAVGGSTNVSAETIDYTLTVNYSGTFNGVSFTDATITVFGDTDSADIHLGGTNNISNVVAPMQVTISGVGTYTFTDVMEFASVNNNLGIADDSAGDQHIVIRDSSIVGYTIDMLGSRSGVAGVTLGDAFPTTGGVLELLSYGSSSSGTFTASTPSAVPEPSALLLLSTGVATIGFGRKRLRARP
jgi:hypothetical protein